MIYYFFNTKFSPDQKELTALTAFYNKMKKTNKTTTQKHKQEQCAFLSSYFLQYQIRVDTIRRRQG